METPEEYFSYFSGQLSGLSHEEIIAYFNESAEINIIGPARTGYLLALRDQIEKRGIDFSEVVGQTGWSFASRVDLVNNKMVRRMPSGDQS